PGSVLISYTTLFRSPGDVAAAQVFGNHARHDGLIRLGRRNLSLEEKLDDRGLTTPHGDPLRLRFKVPVPHGHRVSTRPHFLQSRSEEHTSELQSREN